MSRGARLFRIGAEAGLVPMASGRASVQEIRGRVASTLDQDLGPLTPSGWAAARAKRQRGRGMSVISIPLSHLWHA